MTINIGSLKRLRIYEEPNGSFEVDGSGTLANFISVPFVEGSMKLELTEPYETPGWIQQFIDGYPLKVKMPSSAKLSFDCNLETLDTKAAGGVTAAQSYLGRLLKIVMGQETLGTGTTIASTSTSTSLVCTSAAGIAVGSAIACATGTGGTLEMREVKSKSSNTLTLKLALSGAPATSSVVYSCGTYSLGGTDGSLTTSLQAVLEGLSVYDRYVLRGGQLQSLAIENLGPGLIPKFKFSFMFTRWDYADGSAVAANLSATALGLASYVNAVTLVTASSEFRCVSNGNTSLPGTLNQAPKIDWKPAIKYTAHRSPNSVSTYQQWIRDRSVPVLTGGFTLPEENRNFYTVRTAKSAMAVFYQIGSSPTTGGVLLTAPTVQVDNVQPSIVDGIQAMDISWCARPDEDTTGGNNLAISAMRVHLF